MAAMKSDLRSSEADVYRRWYKTTRWQKHRAAHLKSEPLCVNCKRVGIITIAEIADHVEPHKGDEVKFWNGNLQSLCRSCHSSGKQRQERGGVMYRKGVGLDGWPLDDRHPANRGGGRRT